MMRRIFVLMLVLIFANPSWAAVVYLSSVDGSDASDGLTWANAEATLAAALTTAGAGGTVYVDNAHAETQASSMTLTSPGTAASPVRVICVDRTGDPEPPTARATTATISTTGASNISPVGETYYYGVTLSAGDAANSAGIILGGGTAGKLIFDTCLLKINNTNASGHIYAQNSANVANHTELINTQLQFGSTSQTVILRGPLTWRNTANALAGATFPTILLNGGISAPNAGTTILRGLDLSALGSGKTLVQMTATAPQSYIFENCKLGSSVTISSGSVASSAGASMVLVNCDSADTNYNYHKQTYQGTITEEATIVRTGGATDGTTPISRKMVTTANSKIYSPLVSDPIMVWCDSLAEQTVTVDVITDNVTLQDSDAWIEVEYAQSAATGPLYTTASDRMSDPVFGTPANQTADTNSTWTTTGLVTPVEQELSVTFTPLEKGWYYVRVNLANKPATPTTPITMYYCPKVSGTRGLMAPGGFINANSNVNPVGGSIPGVP